MVEGTVVYDIPLLLQPVVALGLGGAIRLMFKFGDMKAKGSGWVGHDDG